MQQTGQYSLKARKLLRSSWSVAMSKPDTKRVETLSVLEQRELNDRDIEAVVRSVFDVLCGNFSKTMLTGHHLGWLVLCQRPNGLRMLC